uniref:Diphthine--ammonia ligase n=1 Tax=Trichuris muris TaxID=70415 RepID=A0A5S6R2A3_TRIMR
MKVVGLVSGGKDSCYNMCQCVNHGHVPVCVAQLVPPDGRDELDSYMFQTVGHEAVPLISRALCLPILRRTIAGYSVVCDMEYRPSEKDEVEDLYALMREAKQKYDIEAVSAGAICSQYQKERIANVCERLDLDLLAYLWQRDQTELLYEMLDAGMRAILVKTSSLGLDPFVHLGKELNEMLPHFLELNEKIFRQKLVVSNAEVAITNPLSGNEVPSYFVELHFVFLVFDSSSVQESVLCSQHNGLYGTFRNAVFCFP